MANDAARSGEALLWGCEFCCGFRSYSFDDVAEHEATCRQTTSSAALCRSSRLRLLKQTFASMNRQAKGGVAGIAGTELPMASSGSEFMRGRVVLAVSTEQGQGKSNRKLRSSSCEAVMSPSTRERLGGSGDGQSATAPAPHPPLRRPQQRSALKFRKAREVQTQPANPTLGFPTAPTGHAEGVCRPPPTRRGNAFQRASLKVISCGAMGARSRASVSARVAPGAEGPSKLKLRLAKVVKHARGDKLDLVSMRSTAFGSLHDSIAQLSSRCQDVKNAAAALNTARKKLAVNQNDSSMCSAASTEDELGGSSGSLAVEDRVGVRMSRVASRFRAARRSPHMSICLSSCVVRGPLSGMVSTRYSKGSSRRQRGRRKPRYLDDDDDEPETETGDSEEEPGTPELRYMPGPSSALPPWLSTSRVHGACACPSWWLTACPSWWLTALC